MKRCDTKMECWRDSESKRSATRSPVRRNADYLVGMRNLALADPTVELASMLSESETLFVEHNGGLERRRPRRS
jgi:hypothetical protein